MLFLLIMMGSSILVSIVVVFVRMKAFVKKLEGLAEQREERRGARALRRTNSKLPFSLSRRKTTSTMQPDGVVVRGRAIQSSENVGPNGSPIEKSNGTATGTAPDQGRIPALPPLNTQLHDSNSSNAPIAEKENPEPEAPQRDTAIRFNDSTQPKDLASPVSPSRSRFYTRVFSMSGVGARSDMDHPNEAVPRLLPYLHELSIEKADQGILKRTSKYFASSGFIGRNSAFHGLSIKERDDLGGVEYQAVSFLAIIVPIYFVVGS